MTLKVRTFFISLLVLLLPVETLASSFNLTNAQFTNRGVGAFIGQVTDVQVTSSTQYSESGTVELTVTTVIAGTVDALNVTLPFTRALAPTDDEANWDLIQPAHVSFQNIGVGRSLLVHFTQSNGAYFLAPAGNSVQDATEGLLIGKVLKIDDRHKGDNDFDKDDKDDSCREVQVQIIEVVYGWLDGSTTVSLCARSRHDRSDAFGGDLLAFDHDNSGSDHDLVGREVFIAFDKNRISNIEVASTALLQQFAQADTQ
jgi:hypothetical protein